MQLDKNTGKCRGLRKKTVTETHTQRNHQDVHGQLMMQQN